MSPRRVLAWIAVLYFAEGLPFGIVYDVLPVYFRVHGVSLAEIGLMSLLSLPWTWKLAWAPLVDRWGARQHWITACLVVLGAATVLIAPQDPSRPGLRLGGLVLCAAARLVHDSLTRSEAGLWHHTGSGRQTRPPDALTASTIWPVPRRRTRRARAATCACHWRRRRRTRWSSFRRSNAL